MRTYTFLQEWLISLILKYSSVSIICIFRKSTALAKYPYNMFHATCKCVLRKDIGGRIAFAQRIKDFMQLVPNKYKESFFFFCSKQAIL